MYILLDKIRRVFIQLRLFSIRNGWKKAKFLKRNNIFYHMGENCYFHSNNLPAEPFLVCFHNNVVISAGVRLVTHSGVHVMLNGMSNTKNHVCRYGKIEIHDNVYIGADAIINYGVTIHKNCIIAAGAVVTKDVPENSVVAGIPAKVIKSFDDVVKNSLIFSNEFKEMKETKTVKNMLKYHSVVFDIDKEELYKGENK